MNDLIVGSNKEEKQHVLHDLNSVLNNRRGYEYRKPNPDDGIVFIVSGGLDSTVALYRVLNELGNQVWPLYIRRGARSEVSELASLDYYIRDFQKRFPGKLRDLKIIESEVPPKELKAKYPKERLSHIGHPMRNSVLQSIGIQYAVAASYEFNTTIKNVLTAISPDDLLPHCSLVAVRAQTILTCIDNGDWNWQITSPNIEPNLWGDITKIDSIQYAMNNGIDLSKTYTCTQGPYKPCGVCPECHLRLEAFVKAGYQDPLTYDNSDRIESK